ncbi:receptor like protein 30-like [Prunus avium]|uniref:Receptor like protein 30-like n=1 Tax=Prunus avium TaxID=42229 RepID=A0A6P5RTJ7_PRUAV|nr:receptor like protein 30-like [Prunus avium]
MVPTANGSRTLPIGSITSPEKLRRGVMSLFRSYESMPRALEASVNSTLTELPVSMRIRPTSKSEMSARMIMGSVWGKMMPRSSSSEKTQALGQVDECSALLQFKESFAISKSVSADPLAYPKVSFWTREGDGNRSNCCSWDGVECDEDFGHVVGLDLRSSCLYGSINSSNTLFRLVHLQRLDLSDNHFNFSQIPSRFGDDLSSLTYLNLSNSLFSGEIPSEISMLSKLSTLDLSFNFQKLYPDINPLKLTKGNMRSLVQNLTNIKQLHLSWVHIYSTVPDILVNASSLTSLQLDTCGLNGEFPVGIFHLPNLEVLHVSSNPELTGYFPTFNRSNFFKKLGVAYTNFSGQLPGSLGNLHVLRFEQNPVILPWQNLNSLDLQSNMLHGSLPIPPLSIRNYVVRDNNYSGDISRSFCNLNHLHALDLSNNSLSGMLPKCLGNSSSLEILDLHHNSFHGSIPQICPGENSLKMVDLSYNQLQGKVPRSMANCTKLELLNLGSNQISDIFPSWLGALPALRALILRYNGFHGMIGKSATNHDFPKLCIIDLSNNGFSGMLPSNYLENWNSMKFVDDENHQIYFQVSSEPDSSDKHLDNSYVVPYSITTFAKGVELKYFATPYLLRLIDFSSNRFEGEIPAGIIGNLRGVRILSLSNNTLTGLIPSSLANLTTLESLDLSQNQLTGRIPGDLAQLNFLAYFNVSHNHIWGPIPLGQQFGTFLEDSYVGNSGLCGKPLSKKCESSRPLPSSIFEEDEDSGFQIELDWYVVLPGIISGLIIGLISGDIWTSKKHDWFVEAAKRINRRRGRI